MKQQPEIRFEPKYGGGVQCAVYIDGVKHFIEMDHITALLEKTMDSRGYTKALLPRQQYQRIIINE